MLRITQRWLPLRRVVVVADSSFAALDLLAAVTRERFSVVTRLRLDAALYQPAPVRQPGQSGHPCKTGPRLLTLEQVAVDQKTRWRAITMARGYGQPERRLAIASGTAVWSHSGKPAVPIRWVLIRDPDKPLASQALLSTDPKAVRPTDRAVVGPALAGGGHVGRRACPPGCGNPATRVR